MADPVTIAQTGVDPTTGSYLSSEQRKRLFRLSKTRVSSKKVFGSSGGALVPITQSVPDLRPSASSVSENNSENISANKREIESNKFQIKQLQGRLQDLDSRNRQLSSNLTGVSILQSQIDILRQSVNDLRSNLIQVANLINQESQVERLRVQQENAFNSKLASRKLREGKESELERKIQAALIAPVAAIGQQARSVLGDLMSVFQTLFAGWLYNRYVEYVKAKSEDNKKKLNDIKSSVLKNLLIVGGILTALNFGIGRITLGLSRLSFRVGKFVLSNTIGRLFSAIGNLAKNILSKAPKIPFLPGGGKPPSLPGGGKPSGGLRMPNVLGGLGKGIGKMLPFLNIGVSSFLAYENLKEGDLFGAGLNLGSMIPGPIGWASMLGSVGYETFFDKKSDNQQINLNNQQDQSKSEKPSQPTTSMVPFDFKFGVDTENKFGNVFSTDEMGDDVIHSPNQISTEILDSSQISQTTNSTQSTYNLKPQSISGLETTSDLGPEVQKPNIIYRRLNNQSPSGSAGGVPLKTGAATNVPAIPSSNPDNIYVMYSMSAYNVVL